MKNKLEGILEIVVALVVLFSSMWDPKVSMTIAVAALVIFGVIKLITNQQKKSQSEINNK